VASRLTETRSPPDTVPALFTRTSSPAHERATSAAQAAADDSSETSSGSTTASGNSPLTGPRSDSSRSVRQSLAPDRASSRARAGQARPPRP
jgi:hypothetical protein